MYLLLFKTKIKNNNKENKNPKPTRISPILNPNTLKPTKGLLKTNKQPIKNKGSSFI